MKKIMALGLAVVFMVSMVLTGCGKSAGTGQEEAGKGGKVKIRFASWDSAEDLEDQQKLVDAFNEQHDDIEVVLKPTAVILIPKLQQAWVREMRRM